MKKMAVVLLDETGSMTGQEERVCKSMNEYAASLPKKTRLAVFKFDSEHFTKFFSGRAKKWPGMREKDYTPGAMTPLYDTISRAVAYAKRKSSRGDRVMVMIDTDGMENASTDFNLARVSKLIKKCKKRGWEFLFMSSGLDAASAVAVGVTGKAMSVNTMSASYGARGVAYTHAANLTNSYLSTGKTARVDLSVVDEDE